MIENDIIYQGDSLTSNQNSHLPQTYNNFKANALEENCEERENSDISNNDNTQFEGYIYDYDLKPIALRNFSIYLVIFRIFFRVILFFMIYIIFQSDLNLRYSLMLEPLGLLGALKMNVYFNTIYALYLISYESYFIYWFFILYYSYIFIGSLLLWLMFCIIHVTTTIRLSIFIIKLSQSRKAEIMEVIRIKKFHVCVCLS